jgi:hypothetical protein
VLAKLTNRRNAMKPHGSWYFDGYERVEQPKKDGSGTRRVLVYKGEYYGLAGGAPGLRRVKLCSAAGAALCLVAFFYAQLFPSSGGMYRLVAAPGILALVPMMFFVIGLGNFLFAREQWEIRVYYAGYRRMSRWVIALAVLLGVWVLAEAVYLILCRAQVWDELRYLLAALVSAAACLWLVRLTRGNPAVVVKGSTD